MSFQLNNKPKLIGSVLSIAHLRRPTTQLLVGSTFSLARVDTTMCHADLISKRFILSPQ